MLWLIRSNEQAELYAARGFRLVTFLDMILRECAKLLVRLRDIPSNFELVGVVDGLHCYFDPPTAKKLQTERFKLALVCGPVQQSV